MLSWHCTVCTSGQPPKTLCVLCVAALTSKPVAAIAAINPHLQQELAWQPELSPPDCDPLRSAWEELMPEKGDVNSHALTDIEVELCSPPASPKTGPPSIVALHHPRILSKLLQAGLDPNLRLDSPRSSTLLHMLADTPSPNMTPDLLESALLLLRHGADARVQSSGVIPPLFTAQLRGNAPMVALLYPLTYETPSWHCLDREMLMHFLTAPFPDVFREAYMAVQSGHWNSPVLPALLKAWACRVRQPSHVFEMLALLQAPQLEFRCDLVHAAHTLLLLSSNEEEVGVPPSDPFSSDYPTRLQVPLPWATDTVTASANAPLQASYIADVVNHLKHDPSNPFVMYLVVMFDAIGREVVGNWDTVQLLPAGLKALLANRCEYEALGPTMLSTVLPPCALMVDLLRVHCGHDSQQRLHVCRCFLEQGYHRDLVELVRWGHVSAALPDLQFLCRFPAACIEVLDLISHDESWCLKLSEPLFVLCSAVTQQSPSGLSSTLPSDAFLVASLTASFLQPNFQHCLLSTNTRASLADLKQRFLSHRKSIRHGMLASALHRVAALPLHSPEHFPLSSSQAQEYQAAVLTARKAAQLLSTNGSSSTGHINGFFNTSVLAGAA